MVVLIRKEYHGQVWFEVEDVPSKTVFGTNRGYPRRNVPTSVGERNTETDRSVDDSVLQSSR